MSRTQRLSTTLRRLVSLDAAVRDLTRLVKIGATLSYDARARGFRLRYPASVAEWRRNVRRPL